MKIRRETDDYDNVVDVDDIEAGQCFYFVGYEDALYLRVEDEGSLFIDGEDSPIVQAVDLESGYCWRREEDSDDRRAVIVNAEVRARR
jgi:hypothetical protein